MDIKNSMPLFFICALPIVVVFLSTLVSMAHALGEAKRIGMDSAKVKKVLTNSALVSILPTLPIIISMAALMPALGRFIPWFRLSVIGSAPYETMAADIAIKSVGIAEGMGAAEIPGAALNSVLWAMTVGCITSLILTMFFLKAFDNGVAQGIQKGGSKGKLLLALTAAAFPSLLAVKLVPYFFNPSDPLKIVTIVVGGVTGLLLELLAKKSKINLLREFSLPLGMVAAMAGAVIANIVMTG